MTMTKQTIQQQIFTLIAIEAMLIYEGIIYYFSPLRDFWGMLEIPLAFGVGFMIALIILVIHDQKLKGGVN